MIVSLGGQTPLKLSHSIDPALVLGTPGRRRSTPPRTANSGRRSVSRSGLRQPPGDVALTLAEARTIVRAIGYPVLVRPSYVLGGRAMEIVYDDVVARAGDEGPHESRTARSRARVASPRAGRS